jgi:DNA helicase II / ATP-dependent DNA helicase PcrA
MSIRQLSFEQTNAAFMHNVPVCILAGAGSGKTRVITHRIAHLVKEQNVAPHNILGVTFTNKAAREMRNRVESLLPEQGRYVLLGTFHGLSARFLRFYGEFVGVDRDFLIYNEDDAQRLIKKIIKERYHLSKEELVILTSKVLRLRDVDSPIANDMTVATKQAMSILDSYRQRLTNIKALDFSLLLKKFCQLLENEESRTLLCNRVRHLVVDEYQDINAIQAKIVHILACHAQSIAIVGDDDQSIYGWRGASAHFMQQFLDDFKNAQLFKLEDNYRSTKPILDCANALISHNSERLGKNLRSISGDGPLIRLNKHFREVQEAQNVVEQSLQLFEQHGSNFEIAILMRTNAQSRPLEEALHKARMPYRMVGGMRFYDRKEIKDILAALRAILYQHSDVDLLRMLNALSLGIGKKTQESLSNYSGLNGLSFFEAMKDEDHQVSALKSSRSKKKIANLLKLLNEIRSELVTHLSNGEIKILRADEALIYVIDRLGFASRLKHKNDDEAEAKLENIEQLVQAAVSFVEEAESYGEPSDAQSFLENVALVSKDESLEDKNGSMLGTITLMTLHAAKGLEFDGVFLIGLEEGILPHNRSLHGSDWNKREKSIEEERRLLYVGITRAKKRLYLSFCQERFLHGKTSSSMPSRFLREIPSSTIEASDRWILNQLITPYIPKMDDSVKGKKQFMSHDQDSFIKYDFAMSAKEQPDIFNPGERVYHVNYQNGKVVSVTGVGKMTRVKVKFDKDSQVRTIMATHLRIL